MKALNEGARGAGKPSRPDHAHIIQKQGAAKIRSRQPHKTPTMEEEHEQELPQNVADLAQATVPSAIRGIRACKRCGILKTLDQFVDDGCEASSK